MRLLRKRVAKVVKLIIAPSHNALHKIHQGSTSCINTHMHIVQSNIHTCVQTFTMRREIHDVISKCLLTT